MTATVEELQQALADAGRASDAVQWADDPHRVAQEGVYVLLREGDGVTTALISRGEEIFREYYASEAEAVRALHQRLLGSRSVRTRDDEERAASRARMQAKADADRERRRAVRDA